MKTLALTQGPKIRVNAVLPGLLLTEWVGFSTYIRLTLDQYDTNTVFLAKGGEVWPRGYCSYERKINIEARGNAYRVFMWNPGSNFLKTFLDDCADAFIMLAKNNSVTGQQIVVGKCIPLEMIS